MINYKYDYLIIISVYMKINFALVDLNLYLNNKLYLKGTDF